HSIVAWVFACARHAHLTRAVLVARATACPRGRARARCRAAATTAASTACSAAAARPAAPQGAEVRKTTTRDEAPADRTAEQNQRARSVRSSKHENHPG